MCVSFFVYMCKKLLCRSLWYISVNKILHTNNMQSNFFCRNTDEKMFINGKSVGKCVWKYGKGIETFSVTHVSTKYLQRISSKTFFGFVYMVDRHNMQKFIRYLIYKEINTYSLVSKNLLLSTSTGSVVSIFLCL